MLGVWIDLRGDMSDLGGQIDMLTPPTAFPICTIANTPRLPEHCIEWASVLEWPKVFRGVHNCYYTTRRADTYPREKA